MKKLQIQVHNSQGDRDGQTFVQRLKNVIDYVYYSQKLYNCVKWFEENQEMIVGLLNSLWEVLKTIV